MLEAALEERRPEIPDKLYFRIGEVSRLAGIKPGHDWLVYEDSLTAYLALPRKRGPKGPHTLSPKSQAERSSSERNDEDEISHR